MAGAVAKYWGARQPTNGNIYFEWQGGAGIDAQWKAIIADNVPWVELITWNDFNESYIMPMDDFEKYNDWGQPLGWWKPTFGYAELLRYYIAWFKTGAQPTITNDSIFWFYRTQPAAASAANATTGGEGQTGPVSRYIPNPPSGAVPSNADQMFVTVMATVPGTLTSSMGNFSAPVVAGINQFTIPFVAGPAPTFQLSRNGATVINATGADVILANPPYYNWWASSGFAEGNSVRQALEIAVQPRKGP
jgi:glucan endo-1,3-alpha-glucosidase